MEAKLPGGVSRFARHVYNRAGDKCEVTVSDDPQSSFSPDVITSYVWDAIKEIPGVADLHRHPLQSLGEQVHIEGRGPVRLDEQDGRALEVHIVVSPGARIPDVADKVAEAAATYLATMIGAEIAHVHVFVDDVAIEDTPET